MFQNTSPRLRKPAKLHCRTSPAVLAALHAEALRRNRSVSEVLHIILSEHLGFDPVSGNRLASGPDAPPPERGESGPAS